MLITNLKILYLLVFLGGLFLDFIIRSGYFGENPKNFYLNKILTLNPILMGLIFFFSFFIIFYILQILDINIIITNDLPYLDIEGGVFFLKKNLTNKNNYLVLSYKNFTVDRWIDLLIENFNLHKNIYILNT